MRDTKRNWGKWLVGAASLLGGLALYRSRRKLITRWLRLSPAPYRVSVKRNIAIQMPDGVRLMADHYSPKSRKSFPTILVRSPYGRGLDLGLLGLPVTFPFQRFAERGYHVIAQTTRGRLDSEGDFAPFREETEDGIATLNWITRQPWFNGSIGMWGESYLGYAQWAAASHAPAALKSITPAVISSRIYDLIYPNGVFALELHLRWLLVLELLNSMPKYIFWKTIPKLSPSAQDRILEPAYSHLPLIEADKKLLGKVVPHHRLNLKHTDANDPLWEEGNLRKNLPGIIAPAHLMGGWYDFTLQGMLEDYAIVNQSGPRPYLTIGPWHHFNINHTLESIREGLDWFDSTLKGNHYRLRKKPVKIFVMGAETWREMDAYPPAYQETRFYLHEKAALKLKPPEGPADPTHYHYDPGDPTPSVGGPLFGYQAGPKDNRALESRPDVVTFTSSPLNNDLEAIGPVWLRLFVQSSLEHTDFFGRLCDVHPDGSSINICDGIFRIQPGKRTRRSDGTIQIKIDLSATAHRFRRGHRIRAQVSSGAHPRFARNLGTGDPIATGTRMVSAAQSIYHDSEHPSALIMPVVEW